MEALRNSTMMNLNLDDLPESDSSEDPEVRLTVDDEAAYWDARVLEASGTADLEDLKNAQAILTVITEIRDELK